MLALPSVIKNRSPDKPPGRRRKPYTHPDLAGPSISFSCLTLALEARPYRGPGSRNFMRRYKILCFSCIGGNSTGRGVASREPIHTGRQA